MTTIGLGLEYKPPQSPSIVCSYQCELLYVLMNVLIQNKTIKFRKLEKTSFVSSPASMLNSWFQMYFFIIITVIIIIL